MKHIGGMLVLFCLVFGLFAPARAQLAWDPKEFMGVDEITPGMTGYGKTVYQGTKIEKFNIEVVGVLKKLDFGFDMILIKVTSGPVIDRKLQTVAGMSGSPIYIDDRLIGAYAYGWDFQQEAIAGVTPIAAMLECSEPGSVSPPLVGSLMPSNRTLKIGDRLITQVKVAANKQDAADVQAKADPTTMVLTPVATPLMVSGLNEKAMPALQKLLDRYNVHAVQGPGPGQADGPAPPLEAGGAVAVSLMDGDANMSAVGTVTYVKGNTVLAFGHPFFGLGKVNLPMAPAYVHGIVSSSQSSFKLASPMENVGTLISDRQFAVAGTVGQKPDTLPILLYLTDESRKYTRRYSVNLINHPDFTPYLFYLWIINNGAAQMADLSWADGTFAGRAVVSTDKLGDLEQRLIVSPKAGGMSLPFSEVYLLTDMMMANPYEPVKINNLFFDLHYTPGRNTANIEKVTPDRPIARPGETVTLSVKVRPYGKPVETLTSTLKIPEQATEPAMVAIVAGGTMAPLLKSLYTAPPTPEEGLRGIVRILTDNPSAESMLTAQVFPTPSYGYHGQMIDDLTMPLFDVLHSAEAGALPRPSSDNGGRGGDSDAPEPIGPPTTYLFSQNVPYVLTGGQLVTIAIDSQERAVQGKRGDFGFSMQLPVLSTSLVTGTDNPPSDGGEANGDGPAGREQAFVQSLMTPQQRARFAMLNETLRPLSAPLGRVNLPTLTTKLGTNALPLSLSPLDDEQSTGQDVEVEAKPTGDGSKGQPGGPDAADTEKPSGDEANANTPPEPDAVKNLLTHKRPSWGLTGRKDFLRGRHMGTGVTSQGKLVLVPAIRSIYQTNDFIPWKIVTTANGSYVAGWGSGMVVHLADDGKSDTLFPREPLRGVEAVSALATTPDGSLLVGTWPDQRVRLVAADGAVKREWALPGSKIWDLAVMKDGTRVAACDAGMLYILKDDTDVPVQELCAVPDKNVVALTAAPDGGLYVSTAPRGKVYQVNADGVLHSIYDADGAVISMAADAQGNLYVGTSPTCKVIRVSPNGTRQEIMHGMGRGNRHVFALQFVGNDLYAATGPAGGIYRISRPNAADPDVTAIFARQDLRSGSEESDATGPESVMVNSLALTAHGDLLAAASTPGQVLKLEPRTQGNFLSTVLQTPVVARWGQFDQFGKVGDGQSLTVESRSGFTATPDETWSAWEPAGSKLASPSATFAQFRIALTGTKEASPSLSYVRLYYQPVNQPPVVRILSPKTGEYLSGLKDIRWEGHDAEEDQLAYSVFLSKDNGRSWGQMTKSTPKTPEPAATEPAPATKPAAPAAKTAKKKKGKNDKTATPPAQPAPKETPKTEPAKPKWSDGELIDATTMPLDTRSLPDGVYLIKVVASNKYAKPDDPKQGEAIIGPVTLDNTLPTISLPDKVYTWEEARSFTVTDDKAPLIGGKFCLDDGPWTAVTPEDSVFHGTQQAVRLISPAGDITLAHGEHKLLIQLIDAAGNVLNRTIDVAVGMAPPPPPPPVIPIVPPVTPTVNPPPVTKPSDANLAYFMFYGL